jgi:3-hydroxyacyl-[acyl-carrier-protein] dehydratase
MMDAVRIMEIIPHRPPFLMIDEVVSVEEGKKVVALKRVCVDEPYFKGHFPEFPVMPGVLIVEAMAQAGAVGLLSMPLYKGKMVFLGAIDKVKFRKKVVPGDVLRLEVEFVKLKSAAGIGRGVAYVDSSKVAEAELTFFVGS